MTTEKLATSVLLGLLASGCATFRDSIDVESDVDLNELDRNCDPDSRDEGDVDSDVRYFAEVLSQGRECQSTGLIVSTAVEWDDVRDEVPGVARLGFREISTRLDRFAMSVEYPDGTSEDRFPVGTELQLYTGLVRQAEMERLKAFTDFSALFLEMNDDLGRFVGGDTSSGLVAGSHTFDGTEPADLGQMDADDWTLLVLNDAEDSALLDTLADSYAEDDQLGAFTFARIRVPLDALPADGEEVDVEIEVEAGADYEARASVGLGGG